MQVEWAAINPRHITHNDRMHKQCQAVIDARGRHLPVIDCYCDKIFVSKHKQYILFCVLKLFQKSNITQKVFFIKLVEVTFCGGYSA